MGSPGHSCIPEAEGQAGKLPVTRKQNVHRFAAPVLLCGTVIYSLELGHGRVAKENYKNSEGQRLQKREESYDVFHMEGELTPQKQQR